MEIDRVLIENPYHVHVCISDEQFQEVRSKFNNKDDAVWLGLEVDGSVHEWKFENTNIVVVCIDTSLERTKNTLLEVISHEAMHIWQKIKEHIDEQNPSDEFEAMAVSGLIKKINDAINNQLNDEIIDRQSNREIAEN